jgi:hypothetical protein
MTEDSMTDNTPDQKWREKGQRGTQFQPGHPGGPGRPQGSRNKATLALDQIADDAGKAILEMMVEAAKSGDMRAAELVLQRICTAASPADRTDAACHPVGLRCGRSSRRRGR